MNELHAHAESGLMLYAVLLNSSGQIWNGSAFEAVNGANWTSYDVALTEAAAGIYLATMPAVAAGAYSYAVYEQAGASPATTDTLRGAGSLLWDGTAEADLAAIAAAVRTELATELAHLDADVSSAGGGLTPQETADAVHNLAPASTPATGSIGAKLNSLLTYGTGTGTGTYTDTVTDGVDPLDNVLIQLSTDSAGTNMRYQTHTAADGTFTLHPDPGVYYVWLELAGYSFTQGAEVTVT